MPQMVELSVTTGLVVHVPWSGDRHVTAPSALGIVVVVVVVGGSYVHVAPRVQVISGEVTVVPSVSVAIALRR